MTSTGVRVYGPVSWRHLVHPHPEATTGPVDVVLVGDYHRDASATACATADLTDAARAISVDTYLWQYAWPAAHALPGITDWLLELPYDGRHRVSWRHPRAAQFHGSALDQVHARWDACLVAAKEQCPAAVRHKLRVHLVDVREAAGAPRAFSRLVRWSRGDLYVPGAGGTGPRGIDEALQQVYGRGAGAHTAFPVREVWQRSKVVKQYRHTVPGAQRAVQAMLNDVWTPELRARLVRGAVERAAREGYQLARAAARSVRVTRAASGQARDEDAEQRAAAAAAMSPTRLDVDVVQAMARAHYSLLETYTLARLFRPWPAPVTEPSQSSSTRDTSAPVATGPGRRALVFVGEAHAAALAHVLQHHLHWHLVDEQTSARQCVTLPLQPWQA